MNNQYSKIVMDMPFRFLKKRKDCLTFYTTKVTNPVTITHYKSILPTPAVSNDKSSTHTENNQWQYHDPAKLIQHKSVTRHCINLPYSLGDWQGLSALQHQLLSGIKLLTPLPSQLTAESRPVPLYWRIWASQERNI